MKKRKTTRDIRIVSLLADAQNKPQRQAVLIRQINGAFSRWKVGETVLVRHLRGSLYSMTKIKWRGKIPLQNSFAGVPRTALKFL